MKRTGILLLLALLLLVAAAGLKVFIEGRSALAAAYAARDAGNLTAAQSRFLLAARWYLPLVGPTQEAVTALCDLGDSWNELPDYQMAVAAYDDARGALHATAWLVGPDEELLRRADEGYARSLARWKQQEGRTTDVEGEAARYLEIARDVPVPSRFFGLVMGLAFLGYVGCLAVLAWRWDDAAFPRRWWWLGAGAAFALWIVGLLLM